MKPSRTAEVMGMPGGKRAIQVWYFAVACCLIFVTMTTYVFRRERIDKSFDSKINISMNSKTKFPESTKKTNLTLLAEIAYQKATKGDASNASIVTVAIVDVAYIEMFLNFAESLKENGVNNLVPVALSEATKRKLSEEGYPSYLERSLSDIAESENGFKSLGFLKKGAMKFVMVDRLLRLGYSVLLCDLDVFFTQNPFPYFNCKDCDLEIEQDMPHDTKKVCVGIVFFRPTKKCLSFLKTFNDRMASDARLWDQPEFTKILHQLANNGALKFHLLPFKQFMSGYQLHHKAIDPYAFNKSSVVAFHNNWSYSIRMKRIRAKEIGYWIVDTDGYYTNTTNTYLTYENRRPEYTHLETKALYTALKIASHLNRILILPKFHCPGAPKVMCTLDKVLDIDKFDANWEHHYREHRFLKHPKVPQVVKDSQSPRLIIKTKTPPVSSTFDKHGIQFKPKDQLKGPTLEELEKLVSEYKSFKIIRFHSMYFNLKP